MAPQNQEFEGELIRDHSPLDFMRAAIIAVECCLSKPVDEPHNSSESKLK
jgi:hypothetical protein